MTKQWATATTVCGALDIVYARRNAVLAGAVYGVLLYGVMYCVVLALRYPTAFPQTDPKAIALALFPHVFPVGIPLALIARQANAGALFNR